MKNKQQLINEYHQAVKNQDFIKAGQLKGELKKEYNMTEEQIKTFGIEMPDIFKDLFNL